MVAADMTLNPNQPMHNIHAPNARKGMLLTGMGRLNYSDQCQPATHGMHDDRSGKIVKGGAGKFFQPGTSLAQKSDLSPDHAFKKGIDHRHENSGRHCLRPELGAFCNATGNDRGNRRGKSQ
jgi:hypothetical protein